MRSLLVITFLVISFPILGQLDTLRNLEEVVVSANKFELKKKDFSCVVLVSIFDEMIFQK